MLAFFCNHCTIMKHLNIKINSEKNISYENFPVGSWLLPRELRSHIINFYNFARAADNIADANDIGVDKKYKKLEQFAEGINKINSKKGLPQKAIIMAKSLRETKISKTYCLDLLLAFKQDVSKNRYNNWQELVNYCRLSAAPVGRYLIDLHGGLKDGDKKNYEGSDALCHALQILNHLQDCREDFLILNRVYLPLDIMKKHNVELHHLTANTASLELRACLDDILDKVDKLINEATRFPSKLNSWRLAMESQVIISIAIKLSEKLRKSDPIATKIKLSSFAYIKCFILGSCKAFIKC